MISISGKVGEVLDKGLVPLPNSNDKYFNMGIIHQEGIVLINSMLRELAEAIKVKYNLEFETETLIKEIYE